MNYGIEQIIDLKGCNPALFTREHIERFLSTLCDIIQMEKGDLHFWDDVGVPPEEQQTDPHTKGTTAIQFILTSNITIHTLDLLGEVYINIFSCKSFDEFAAGTFARAFFGGHFQMNISGKEWRIFSRGMETES